MPWTPVPKPTAQTWTPIEKPSESSVISFSGGEPIGMLMALTYTVVGSSVLTGWTDIPQPTSSVWTLVNKPTD